MYSFEKYNKEQMYHFDHVITVANVLGNSHFFGAIEHDININYFLKKKIEEDITPMMPFNHINMYLNQCRHYQHLTQNFHVFLLDKKNSTQETCDIIEMNIDELFSSYIKPHQEVAISFTTILALGKKTSILYQSIFDLFVNKANSLQAKISFLYTEELIPYIFGFHFEYIADYNGTEVLKKKAIYQKQNLTAILINDANKYSYPEVLNKVMRFLYHYHPERDDFIIFRIKDINNVDYHYIALSTAEKEMSMVAETYCLYTAGEIDMNELFDFLLQFEILEAQFQQIFYQDSKFLLPGDFI